MPVDPPRPEAHISPFRGEVRPLAALRFDPGTVDNLAARILPPGPSAARTGAGDKAPSLGGALNALFPPHQDDIPALPGLAPSESLTALYQDWRAKGEMIQDPAPSLYLHELTYRDPLHNVDVTRRGFFALLAITATGQHRILPHEQTLPERVTRQVDIYRWRGAQVLPLFLLYSDQDGSVMKRLEAKRDPTPIMAFKDGLEQDNRLWRVSGPDIDALLSETLGDKPFLIADGHHRFEAARRFARESAPETDSDDIEAVALTFFTATEDPGLRMGSFHRGIRGLNLSERELLATLDGRYKIDTIPIGDGDPLTLTTGLLDGWLAARDQGADIPPSFVLYPRGATNLYTLVCQEPSCREDPATARLDVTDLHQTLLPLLGNPEGIDFEEDPSLLMAALQGKASPDAMGTLDLGIFLNPPKAETVWDVARTHVAMPPKATYFYPKLLAGLLHYPLNQG